MVGPSDVSTTGPSKLALAGRATETTVENRRAALRSCIVASAPFDQARLTKIAAEVNSRIWPREHRVFCKESEMTVCDFSGACSRVLNVAIGTHEVL
jgi:hypothetical protein